MKAADTIQYLERRQVDTYKWDNCIDAAGNGLIYGYSWYLDAMAGDWGAVVVNDYEAVMPLPWRKKWGVYYIYQPFLTAQLGLFGNRITPLLLQNVLSKIPPRFRLWEFPLNYGNLLRVHDFNFITRTNLVLSLVEGYDRLEAGYRENTKRNIRKCRQYGCHPHTNIPVSDIKGLATRYLKPVDEEGLNRFETLYAHLHREGKAISYGVFSKPGELLASAAFLYSHKRWYYLLTGHHPNGRTLGASHTLIDAFIKDHAGSGNILDFEGSDLRSLAFFYTGLGATQENYPSIQLNKLPWYAHFLKK